MSHRHDLALRVRAAETINLTDGLIDEPLDAQTAGQQHRPVTTIARPSSNATTAESFTMKATC